MSGILKNWSLNVYENSGSLISHVNFDGVAKLDVEKKFQLVSKL